MLNKFLTCIIFIFLGINNVFAGTDKVIIAFGDSITVGKWENNINEGNGSRTGGYGPDLESLTDGINNHHDVLNYGFAGEKTIYQHPPEDQGGYVRLISDVLPKHPNAKYILILEGTNDYWTGVSKQTTVNNLGWMVDACRNYNIEPVLSTLTPDTTAGIGYKKNIPAYNELILALSQNKNVTLVDMYSAMVDEWDSKYAYGEDFTGRGYDDNLHLSRAGYSKMAELWMEKLDIPTLGSLSWLMLLLKD